jgi:hypothetical protein
MRAKCRAVFGALSSGWAQLEGNDRAFTAFVLVMGILPCLLITIAVFAK